MILHKYININHKIFEDVTYHRFKHLWKNGEKKNTVLKLIGILYFIKCCSFYIKNIAKFNIY